MKIRRKDKRTAALEVRIGR